MNNYNFEQAIKNLISLFISPQCSCNCIDNISIYLIYTYQDGLFSAERNEDAPVLIRDILKYFRIEAKFYYFSITNFDKLDEFINRNKINSIFIFVNALGSGSLNNLYTHLYETYRMKNMFIVNSYSTANIQALNSNNIMRLLPTDGLNASVFKTLLLEPESDHIIFLIQESNLWARELANEIEVLFDHNIVQRFDIDDENIQIPEGQLSVLALSEPIIERLMRILYDRQDDVKILLMGDASFAERPNNAEQLDFLNNMNSGILVSRSNNINYDFVQLLQSRTNIDTISPLIGVTISTIQIGVYLKKCIISSLKNYKNQFFLSGIDLDRNTLDSINPIFNLLTYTNINEPANHIKLLGYVVYQDSEPRIHIARQVI